MILITGAAGKTGTAVIKSLLARGQSVRALVRRDEQAAQLEKMGVAEVFIGDMSKPSTLRQAAKEAVAIYHICPNMHPQELAIGEHIVSAAQSAGVERFVYHSVLHPQIEQMPHHWQKMRVEEKLFESNLAFTILQPAAYMQNVLAGWEQIVNEGVYAVPYALQTRLTMVDLQDVAQAAAEVLTTSGHEGATYELCGSEFLSQVEVAAVLEKQLARPVHGQVITVDSWKRRARSAGLQVYAVDALAKMFYYYERVGFLGNGRVLGWLLGRPPTTFAAFIERSVREMTAPD